MNIKKNQLVPALFIFSSFIAYLVLFVLFNDFFVLWNHQINDSLMILRYKTTGRQPVNPFIVHMDLNDSTISELGISHMDRTPFAQLIDILDQTEVAMLTFDLLFAEERLLEGDELLAGAISRAHNIFLPVIPQTSDYRKLYISESDDNVIKTQTTPFLIYPEEHGHANPPVAEHVLLPLSKFLSRSTGVGHIFVEPDNDGIYRRVPLLIKYQDGYIPSLSLQTACNYLQVNPSDIIVHWGKFIQLNNCRWPGGMQKNIKIPIDSTGRITVNFIGPWHDSFFHYSMSRVIAAKNDQNTLDQLRDELAGSIIIISDISTFSKEHESVPIEKVYPMSGLHSTIINSILTNTFIHNEPIAITILMLVLLFAGLWLLSVRSDRKIFTVIAPLIFVLYLSVKVSLALFLNYHIHLIVHSLIYATAFIGLLIYRYFKIDEMSRELQRLNSELVAKNQFKSTYLANMSHEIRTPLNSILGFNQLLKYGNYDPKEIIYDINQEILSQVKEHARAGPFIQELVSICDNLQNMSESKDLTIDMRAFYRFRLENLLLQVKDEKSLPEDALVKIAEMVDEIREKQTEEIVETEKNLEYTLNSGNYLLELINTVLDIAKIEAGRVEIQTRKIEMLSFIEDIFVSASYYMKEKNKDDSIKLLQEINLHLPQFLIFDSNRIKQILLNLLSNAIKFTMEGSVTFSVSYKSGLLLFSVTDTGIGIKKEEQHLLFKEFSRTAATSDIEGTGLGLALSRKLVELHNGSITFESEFGKGSSFHVTIPV